MEKPIDHDLGSSATTVVGSTAAGAAKGVGMLALGAVGAVLATGAALYFAVSFPIPALVVALAGAGAAATSSLWMPVAGIGAAYGAYKGVSKVKGEQKSFNTVAHNIEQNAGASVQQAGQQAYMAGLQEGVQAGRQEVIEKLQQVQAQQAQLTTNKNEQAAMAHPADNRSEDDKWANRFKKNSGNAVSPEAIAQQREAAAHAPAQLG